MQAQNPPRIAEQLKEFTIRFNHLGEMSAYSLRQLNDIFTKQETIIMARSPSKAKNNRNFTEIQFINYKLNKQEKARFETWAHKVGNTIFDRIDPLLESGHKVTFSSTPGEGVVRCSVTCTDEASANKDMCLTSRAKNWAEALAVTVFKIEELSNDGVWADLGEDEDWG